MKKNLKINFRLINVILLASLLVLLSIYPVYSWFSFSNKKGHVGDIEIHIPPVIYIKDDGLEEMTSFNLDGLQINTIYNFVFCVSPVKQNIVKNFQIGVVYTENIGMNIEIYPVTNISYTEPASDVYEKRELTDTYDSNTEKNVYFEYNNEVVWGASKLVTYGNDGNTDPDYDKTNLNRGVHKIYRGMKFTSGVSGWSYDNLLSSLTDTSHYVFFNLQITWEGYDNVDVDKEVDIVYIVTKGTAADES